MAITAATQLSDFSGFLNAEQSAPIFDMARRISAVQRLSRQVPLGANGKAVPVTTGKMSAGWVAEGTQKPASNGTMTLKTIEPKKIAAIAVVSAEVIRANPGGYVDQIRPQIAEAFAGAFDRAALRDEGPDGTAGGGPFSTYVGQTTKAVELGTGTTAYNDVVAGLSLLTADGKKLRGFALDDRVEPIFLDELDANNRPIFIDSPLDETTAAMFAANDAQPARPGRLIGRPSWFAEGVGADTPAAASTTYHLGYGGDWTQCAWGVVGGISYKVSTEATVTINGSLVSLFENNLVAILGEAEYGFLCNDPESFVAYTETTPV